MKQFLIVYLLFLSANVFSQNVAGYVMDSVTRLPIPNAQVISKNGTVLTNDKGKFDIAKVSIGDRVSFRIMGYESVERTIKKEMFPNPMHIYLTTKGIALSEVKIKASRNYKKDSLDLRKEYGDIFNYQGPKITDAFIKVDPNYKSPHANVNPNSTSSILKLNVLQLVSLIGKNKAPISKLKQTLLKDEEEKHIDYIFSKSKVELSTPLKGDSLQAFLRKYRPTYLSAKKMNEYEVILYIKKSYAEFIKP